MFSGTFPQRVLLALSSLPPVPPRRNGLSSHRTMGHLLSAASCPRATVSKLPRRRAVPVSLALAEVPMRDVL